MIWINALMTAKKFRVIFPEINENLSEIFSIIFLSVLILSLWFVSSALLLLIHVFLYFSLFPVLIEDFLVAKGIPCMNQ